MDIIKNISELEENTIYLASSKDYVFNQNHEIVYTGWFLKKVNHVDTRVIQEIDTLFSDYTIEVSKIPNHNNTVFVEPPVLKQIMKQLTTTFDNPKTTVASEPTNLLVEDSKQTIYALLSVLEHSHHKSVSLSERQIDGLYHQIAELLNEDLASDIQSYKQSHNIYVDGGVYNPLIDNKQLGKISSILHNFLGSLSPDQTHGIVTNRHRTGYNPILAESAIYLYEKYHKEDAILLGYNNAISILKKNFLLLNPLFGEIDGHNNTMLHPDLLLLLADVMSRIEIMTRQSYDVSSVVAVVCDEVMEKIRDTYIEDLEDDEKSQYEEIYLLIQDNITSVVYYKNTIPSGSKIEESVDTCSAKYLFTTIHTYYLANDKENVVHYIQELQQCDDREILSLLSPEDLRDLIAMIERVDEEYLFASRIRDLIHTLRIDELLS